MEMLHNSSFYVSLFVPLSLVQLARVRFSSLCSLSLIGSSACNLPFRPFHSLRYSFSMPTLVFTHSHSPSFSSAPKLFTSLFSSR